MIDYRMKLAEQLKLKEGHYTTIHCMLQADGKFFPRPLYDIKTETKSADQALDTMYELYMLKSKLDLGDLK